MKWLFVGLFCVFFAGCSSKPSEAMAVKALQEKILSGAESSPVILVQFKKTNAVSNSEKYLMEYEAELRFIDNGTWYPGDDPANPKFDFVRKRQRGITTSTDIFSFLPGGKTVTSGQQEKVYGVLTFIKTEKGWRAI